jgi:hypothetical protein
MIARFVLVMQIYIALFGGVTNTVVVYLEHFLVNVIVQEVNTVIGSESIKDLKITVY